MVGGAVGVPVALGIYVLLMPEKAQIVAGWIWGLIAKVVRRADKTAVALKVQGHINDARSELLREAPPNLIKDRLRINWNDAEEASSVMRDGEVVVFMRRSDHHEENVARALMAYLPKAVIPRARRYVDPKTMRAADFTLAKAVLGKAEQIPGALDVFFDRHLDPESRADRDLYARIVQMDEIDLHGWLLRVLLPEFRNLGDQLHPGEPPQHCVRDAERFALWLHGLAARAPGDDKLPLAYEGAYFRVAMVLVANRYKLMDQGIEPYRKQAKRLLYDGRYDSVYLMARDDNIYAVREIVERLRGDGLVAEAAVHEYGLRADFKKRKLPRDRGVVACLRRRDVKNEATLADRDEIMAIEVDRFIANDDEATRPTSVVGDGKLGERSGRRTRFVRKSDADLNADEDAGTTETLK